MADVRETNDAVRNEKKARKITGRKKDGGWDSSYNWESLELLGEKDV